MPKNFYSGLGIVILIVGSILFVYWTSSPAVPQTPEAEFGGVSLRLDYATTEAERARGLSDRESIPSDYGMLFVFAQDGRYGFWMKDTLVSLDLFWLDSKGHVVTIAENITPESYPSVFYPTAPARYVLETVAGFARTHAIVLGTPLLLKSFPIVTE